MKRLPILPTLIVLIAVAVMVRLGFWQIERLHQKNALLVRYQTASRINGDAPWPATMEEAAQLYFRHARIVCRPTAADAPLAGRSTGGEPGWAHLVPCALADGRKAEVVIGWSRDPAPATWHGGEVSGIIARGIHTPARLVASPPLAGLAASAAPDPKDVPNNHLSYAVQWFLFAAVALVIYALALRKRLAGAGMQG